jgi:hypothetical protein
MEGLESESAMVVVAECKVRRSSRSVEAGRTHVSEYEEQWSTQRSVADKTSNRSTLRDGLSWLEKQTDEDTQVPCEDDDGKEVGADASLQDACGKAVG